MKKLSKFFFVVMFSFSLVVSFYSTKSYAQDLHNSSIPLLASTTISQGDIVVNTNTNYLLNRKNNVGMEKRIEAHNKLIESLKKNSKESTNGVSPKTNTTITSNSLTNQQYSRHI